MKPLRLLDPSARKRTGATPGHIFNLGRGLVPQVPSDNVKYPVDAVHRYTAAPI